MHALSIKDLHESEVQEELAKLVERDDVVELYNDYNSLKTEITHSMPCSVLISYLRICVNSSELMASEEPYKFVYRSNASSNDFKYTCLGLIK